MLYFTPTLGVSTMERRLSLNQIAVPDDFPSDKFDAVSGKLGCHAYIRDALNAIAYRFTALAEYDERLRSLINAPDGQPFRYMQERDLFGFYSNAHSVFDAFCFALFAVGALIDPGNFPLASEADERGGTRSPGESCRVQGVTRFGETRPPASVSAARPPRAATRPPHRRAA
jgi:hypothetical protein